MVSITQTADADVTLRRTGVPPEQFDTEMFSRERMGVPSYVRLQIPTSMASAAEVLRVLEWLGDQVRLLRRENFDSDWKYGSRLKTLAGAANLQLQKYTKSGG